MKPEVGVVWFKRDFRLIDNEALFHSHQSGLPLLLICFLKSNPSLSNDCVKKNPYAETTITKFHISRTIWLEYTRC
jgi:deoxyribodipyrimidine photolyase